MSANFKTCLFGGFDRKDVISFIEKSAQESREKIEKLDKENETLLQQNESMSAELQLMREKSADILQQSQKIEELTAKLDVITKHCSQLESENSELKGQAEEYLAIKDHIAEIEISAHRRTEEFRSAAISRLREILKAQRTWCQETRQQYDAVSQRFGEKLLQAQQTISSADMSAFDNMELQLQTLDESLDAPEDQSTEDQSK